MVDPVQDKIVVKDLSIDYEGVQALKDVNYQGPVVIESFTSQVKEIARAVCIWREIARDWSGQQREDLVLARLEPIERSGPFLQDEGIDPFERQRHQPGDGCRRGPEKSDHGLCASDPASNVNF